MPRPHSRAIVLPTTLTTPMHAPALALDLLHRGQVSKVSPDWLTAI